MSASGVAVAVLQTAFMVAISPSVVGVMRKVRARLEGRVGAPISQPWRDLRKLSRKQRMVSEHTSWVFSIAPIVLVASTLTVAAIVPSLSTVAALTQVGDLFAVAYLLLLGTVFLALAGLDTATAFGGMGASRAMTVAAISEPTIVVSIFALSVTAGSSNLGAIVSTTLDRPSSALSPESLLAFAALVVVVVAEAGRIPVDNPATHLELTMIHEAMTLDMSGPDLALVELSAYVRMVVLFSLLVNLFIPWGIATGAAPWPLAVALVAAVVKIVGLGVAIAIGEVFLAKLRIFRVPELLAASFGLAFLAVTASFFLGAPT